MMKNGRGAINGNVLLELMFGLQVCARNWCNEKGQIYCNSDDILQLNAVRVGSGVELDKGYCDK